MRKQVHHLIFLLLISIFLLSCSKDRGAVPAPILPPLAPSVKPDTLSGREFMFDDLIWTEGYDDDGIENYATFITTADRPDLFNSQTRKFEVSFKFDSTSVWIVPQSNYYYAPNGYYYWYYHTKLKLRILTNNLTRDLVGKKASVRIKVL
jgi:hypothetical protein